LIDPENMPRGANAARDHQGHRARSAADIEHSHCRPDTRLVEHSLGHLIDLIQHRCVLSLGAMIGDYPIARARWI
jgi:hypothetical protein